MREDEFRTWLASGGAQTEAGRNTRIYAVRTIEQKLSELGFSWPDLDAAFAADRFTALRDRLRAVREDAVAGGQDYRILMPNSDKPQNRLSSWRSWLGQYGKFLAGDTNQGSDADVIRSHVLENYIEPARLEGRPSVDVSVRDVNTALELEEGWPNICQALQGEKFLDLAQISRPERFGANASSATSFRFWLDEAARRAAILEHFVQGHPRFSEKFASWEAEEQAIFLQLALLIHDAGFDWYHVKQAPYQLRFGRKEKGAPDGYPSLGMIYRSPPVLSIFRKKSDGKGLGDEGDFAMNEADFARFAERFTAEAPAEARRSPPRSPRSAYWPDELSDSPAPEAEILQEEITVQTPINEILYGPPGTGKTFTTARRAVELCGEAIPDDPESVQGRAALMTTYNRLREEGRIEFVTFHQNFSYEDFVEGLRPPVADDGNSENDPLCEEVTGLRLKVHKGIFRELAERAILDRGQSSPLSLDATRPIFKISLGERGVEEQEIRASLDRNEISLGWGDSVDWSDPRFEEFSEILAHWRAQRVADATGKDANVEQLYGFRSWMQEGDYVVISDGRDRFRAVGRVTGPYRFVSDAKRHPHRRSVEWLWRDDAGRERSLFYPPKFRPHSCYCLASDVLDWAALSSVVAGDAPMPHRGMQRSYVLVIDEINRANVSRVFGELITLIEADKRLGQTNALEVRLPYSQKLFGVPANLHILGTMNTADRSIALLDTALRRRFEFTELAPEPLKLAGKVPSVPLDKVLDTINQRLEYLLDRDHRIGHAFFYDCVTKDDADRVMRRKVLPLLQEYFFEDWSSIFVVVGAGFVAKTNLLVPPGLEGRTVRKDAVSWCVRDEFPNDAYTILLGKAVSSDDHEGDDIEPAA